MKQHDHEEHDHRDVEQQIARRRVPRTDQDQPRHHQRPRNTGSQIDGRYERDPEFQEVVIPDVLDRMPRFMGSNTNVDFIIFINKNGFDIFMLLDKLITFFGA